jgi:hypothetical protein
VARIQTDGWHQFGWHRFRTGWTDGWHQLGGGPSLESARVRLTGGTDSGGTDSRVRLTGGTDSRVAPIHGWHRFRLRFTGGTDSDWWHRFRLTGGTSSLGWHRFTGGTVSRVAPIQTDGWHQFADGWHQFARLTAGTSSRAPVRTPAASHSAGSFLSRAGSTGPIPQAGCLQSSCEPARI